MDRREWGKFGIAGVMFAGFFAGMFEEGQSQNVATIYFSLAMVAFGVLLTMVIIDWWRDRHNDDLRGGGSDGDGHR